MNTELSFATSIVIPGGKSACNLGIMARTPLLSSNGLAVAWRITPAVMATLPLSREPLRSSAAASSTRPTSRMRTGNPAAFLMMMSANWPDCCKSVCEVTLNSRCVDSIRPAGTSRLLRRIASSASCVVNLKAASLSGSSQTRMAYLRSPKIRTSAAPVTVCKRGLAMRFTRSLICNPVIVSLVNESQITGKASASTLAMTGSSIAWGSRLRTREVRSRTSAAAVSASFSSRKRIEICACSARLMEVMTSTASMPAMESSNGLVT